MGFENDERDRVAGRYEHNSSNQDNTNMATSFRKLFDSLSEGLNKMAGIETEEQRDARRARELNGICPLFLFLLSRKKFSQ